MDRGHLSTERHNRSCAALDDFPLVEAFDIMDAEDRRVSARPAEIPAMPTLHSSRRTTASYGMKTDRQPLENPADGSSG